MHRRLLPVALLLLAAAPGCTSFATVRSAQVMPGPSVTVQGSVTSPPGGEAGWFWSLDCGECNQSVAAADLGYTYGYTGNTPYTLGVGVNGLLYPYVEVYSQFSRDTARAYGMGARLGVPVAGWSNHQVYGRVDVPLASGARVLLNPGVFLHVGNSPNGENPGHFLAFVQGVGLERRGERSTVVPALTLVVGRGDRRSYGERIGPFTSVFGAASVSITFHRRRSAQ